MYDHQQIDDQTSQQNQCHVQTESFAWRNRIVGVAHWRGETELLAQRDKMIAACRICAEMSWDAITEHNHFRNCWSRYFTRGYESQTPEDILLQNLRSKHGEIFSKSYLIKGKSDCIYHFSITLESNGSPFDSKSIGNW